MNVIPLRSVLPAMVITILLSPSAGRCAEKPDAGAQKPYEIRVERDIAYYTGEGADKARHKLDIYLPKGKQDIPVVLFVHGGAWMLGDKDNSFFGVHRAVGKMFAGQGVATVVINYRLSPSVMHPEHVKDVARAFAWTHENIKKYGGRPDQIFLCGHSAGGHLVSLLATDETYLKAHGLSFKDIKGVISMSGVYGLADNMFNEVFGKDPAVRKQACPLHQVREGCPPFLIVWAQHDYPFCDLASKQFCKALKDKNVEAATLEVKNRNHFDVIGKATAGSDPCAVALMDFVARHAKE
jgi:acetyl esterase/lipase